MASENTEPRFIKPKNNLKLKVGHGGIPPDVLKQSQSFIENTAVDFAPIAADLLKSAEAFVEDIKKDPELGKDKKFLEKLAEPIMGLKANGGMFKYPMISMIADIGLQFIDRAGEINAEGVEILRAHNNAIALIVQSKLKGYIGDDGQVICEELHDACLRYYKKYNLAH